MTSRSREGDWVRGESGAKDAKVQSLRADDVVHAYRWILGREPESLDRIGSHLEGSGNNAAALRTRFLRSPEFARTIERLGLAAGLAADGGAEPVPAATRRAVFLHVPKTGGTSLHAHLAERFPDGAISPVRQNDLLQRPVLDLAAYTVFSGHFDRRCLDVIPGRDVVAFTLLREPRQRLVSVYRYLRAHRPERALAEGLDLARIARKHSFERFLAIALDVNPAAVDNVYVRAFGGTLPLSRWERAAEASWMEPNARIGDEERERMLARALAFLGQLDVVVLLEGFSTGIQKVFQACGLGPAPEPMHLKRTDDIGADTIGFEPVERIDPPDGPMLEYCTRWDRSLYEAMALRT